MLMSITQTDKRTDYPGKDKAKIVQKWWNNNYGGKITLVIGNEWEAGNLSYHLKDRPEWTDWTSEFKELRDSIYLCGEGNNRECFPYK